MSRSICPLGWHGRAAIVVSLALWLLPAWPQASAPAAKATLTVNLVAPHHAEWPRRLPANGNINNRDPRERIAAERRIADQINAQNDTNQQDPNEINPNAFASGTRA